MDIAFVLTYVGQMSKILLGAHKMFWIYLGNISDIESMRNIYICMDLIVGFLE